MPVGKLAAIVLPSLSSAVFVITLVNVLFLSSGASTLFRDADTGWHVRTGEGIIQHGAIPHADPYSLVHAGREWFAWEWLADTMLGTAHLVAGPAGVALLAALMISATGWGAWRLALSFGANLFVALVVLVPMLGTTTIHWLARPHLYSWLLGLAFIAIAEHYRRGLGRARWLWLLPVLACLWANVHGSFLLATAALLAYAAGEWLHPTHPVRGCHFALAALGSLLATFINPYTWHLHEHIFGYLRNSYLMDHISEFRSFSFHAPGALYVELFLLLAAVGTACLLKQKCFGPALLSLALLHLSLYSARHLPTYAVLMTPVFAAAISTECSTIPRFQAVAEYCSRLLAMERRVLGVIPTAMGILVVTIALRAKANGGEAGFDARKFPAAAANFLERGNMEARRVFARDYWGGFLIYRFNGRMKVFVDGRSDFYGSDWLETYAAINELRPGWDQLLDAFEINTVLIPPHHPLAAALHLKPGWRVTFTDSVAAVFERQGG